ncbi:MAG: hypothetical protein HQ515_11610 [Phycisphaeraceae bacterium]|nr:hypothetical protein [Phycisphaeraceae bacterium]
MRSVILGLVFAMCGLCNGTEIAWNFDLPPSEQEEWDCETLGSTPGEELWLFSSGVLTLDTTKAVPEYGPNSSRTWYEHLYLTMTQDPLSLSFRAKCLSEEVQQWGTAQSFFFSVVVDNIAYNVVLGPDRLGLREFWHSTNYYNFNNEEFHDYVMLVTPGETRYTLIVDDTDIFYGNGEISRTPNRFRFGDSSSTGNAHGEITALTFRQPYPPENEIPIADAGADQEHYAEASGAKVVTLDGSDSSDPDSTPGTNDDIVSFSWSEGGTPLGVGETLEQSFGRGEHVVTLEVIDSAGESDTDDVVVTILNNPPVADAGADQEVISSNGVNAAATLDGSGSDEEGDPLTYTWTDGGPIVPGEAVEMTLPVGDNTITLTVSDGPDEGTDEIVVTVITTSEATENLANLLLVLDLPSGTRNALAKSLDAAVKSFDKGKVNAGVNQLRAIQNKVNAQSGKKIDAKTAAEIILLAQDIIDAAAG